MINVIKRDGSIEEFDLAKLEIVAQAAGLDKKQSQELAKNIAFWVEKSGVTEITSLKIRDKILSDMQKINESAAKAYQWYESTKQ